MKKKKASAFSAWTHCAVLSERHKKKKKEAKKKKTKDIGLFIVDWIQYLKMKSKEKK
jgi:hypothetical protein